MWQSQEVIKKLIKKMYLWIINWEGEFATVVYILRNYKPKLHYCNVVWRFPEKNTLKYNTDGASKGNPGISVCAFCVRDDKRDLIYARAKGLGVTTNTQEEMKAIKETLHYMQEKAFNKVTIKTDSLVLMRMINKQWKVPWELVE